MMTTTTTTTTKGIKVGTDLVGTKKGFSGRKYNGAKVKMTKIHYIHVWHCQKIKQFLKILNEKNVTDRIIKQ